MKFSINNSLEIIERTPHTLHKLLYNINEEWSHNNEGGETWSAYDVIGHLIHCDEYNWIPRIKVVHSGSLVRNFQPLDKFAQLEKSKGKNLNQLLDDFVQVRASSIVALISLKITNEKLSNTAIHPELGTVTLSQLISTWAVHDLDHISQIVRVMAKQYQVEVGPWVKYMRVLK